MKIAMIEGLVKQVKVDERVRKIEGIKRSVWYLKAEKKEEELKQKKEEEAFLFLF
jgi:hypothetical protein